MAILDEKGRPLLNIVGGRFPPDPATCDHGIEFNIWAANGLSPREVRKRWPRLHGNCPKGCGFVGIGYASRMHFILGDW